MYTCVHACVYVDTYVCIPKLRDQPYKDSSFTILYGWHSRLTSSRALPSEKAVLNIEAISDTVAARPPE